MKKQSYIIALLAGAFFMASCQDGNWDVPEGIPYGNNELVAGTRQVYDVRNFTVGGQHLTTFLADVDDFGDYAPDTEVIKTANGITYVSESDLAFRSAPYFNIEIDGITLLDRNYG